MTRSINPKLVKWQGQVERISDHLLQLHHHRALWREMTDALAVGDEHGFFTDHYTQLYVDGAAMAVRRLADTSRDRRIVSIGRLLTELIAYPTVITREVYVARYDDYDDTRERARTAWLEKGREEWDRDWSDREGRLNVENIAADLRWLADVARKVTALADRRIAHIDSRQLVDPPTFKDLDQAVDALGTLFKRYAALITGQGWAFLEPSIQGDWKRPFRVPLFEPLQIPWTLPTPPDVPQAEMPT